MEKTCFELVKEIRDVLREKAKTMAEAFNDPGNGAIRISIYPLCTEADEWLGGLGDFEPEKKDIVDYEWTFAISSGGSRVISGVWEDGPATVDCYAFSALKIAHCSLAQGFNGYLRSGLDLQTDNLTEEYGYGPYKGALCVEVNEDDEGWCGVYVCVSGAKQSLDDEICALEAVPVIKKFFEGEKGTFGNLSTHFE